jgi:hypothetical protein
VTKDTEVPNIIPKELRLKRPDKKEFDKTVSAIDK